MKAAIIVTFIVTAVMYISSQALMTYLSNNPIELLKLKYNMLSTKALIAGLLFYGSRIGVVILVVLILIYFL